MDKDLKSKFAEVVFKIDTLSNAVNKVDRDVLVIVTRFDGLEEKVNKVNGFCDITIENKRSITFLTKGFWIGIAGLLTGLGGVVFLIIRSLIK